MKIYEQTLASHSKTFEDLRLRIFYLSAAAALVKIPSATNSVCF